MSALSYGSSLQTALRKNSVASSLLGLLLAEEDDTVRVRRRRRAGAGDSGERERAATPERQRESGGPPTGSGGGGSSGGGPRPSGGKIPGGGLGLIGIIILVVLGMIFGRSNTPQESTTQEQTQGQQAAVNTPAATPRSNPTATQRAAVATTRPAATRPAAAGATTSGETWTVMLYQDADDKVLEKDIYVDLNEAERVGSTDNVHIVAQVDRYRGGYEGDGNWTSAKRFYVTQDDDLQTVGSQLVADLGEVNMADSDTLVDFVTWAMDAYPADKYALIMSDHGMGWPGGWSDPTASGADRSSPLSAKLSDMLYLNELDAAFQQIRDQTGLEKFELIGMDACLMAHIEVFSALEPHARYAVASQETEPALGWAYTSFLGALAANPAMNGAQLSEEILSSYIADDQRIVDDEARAELVGRGQPMGGLFDILMGQAAAAPSAQQVAAQMGQNVTLSAIDLSAMPALMSSVNDFANTLQSVSPQSVAKVRTYTQSFTSIFGSQVPASYIDLGHFVQLFKKAGASGALGQAGDAVLAALDRAVIGETHGPKLPGATGISIYFPVSQLYNTAEAGPRSYTVIADRFANNSLWDDYLAFHYTGRDFEPDTNLAAVPDTSTAVRGPGAGGITVAPITLSDTVAAPGKPILITTHIEGQNVGYVYFFTGYYDSAANSILTVDMDYLESDETGELNGVYYPIWPEDGSFDMEFEWEPTVFAITDGTTTATTVFQPETYGAEPENAVYTVDGTYTYGDDGESRPARLYFSDGVLQQVFGFTGTDDLGSPREIIPQAGDSFTVQERWMDLDANGNVVNVATEAGATLTFSDQPFTWVEQDAAAGNYIIGFIVEDLDGNKTHVYAQVAVE